MKKYMTCLLLVIAALFIMTGCGGDKQEESAGTEDTGLKIVTTIFPEYDWVNQVLGENPAGAEVTMLLDDGVDLHSFQPTAEDFQTLSTCDIFIYVGGESDEWVEDALKESVNKDMTVINLLDVMGENAKEEEVVEGMEAEHEEGEEAEEEEGPEYDEHVWLSLKNAALFTDTIAEALGKADPENADYYRSYADTYKEDLLALDEEYKSAADGAKYDTVLFGDRFPFRYMTDDYGLKYYAAFVGCSAETEASFETIKFLAGKMDELGLPAVMTIEGGDQKIAQTIVATTKNKDQKILSLDSMQSVTTQDVEEGASYIDIMTKNLEVLKEALQ